MSRKSSSDDSVFNGVSLIIAAVFVLSLADAAVKYFSSTLPLWQLFLIVSCLSVPALAAWIGSRSKTARIGIASVRLIMIRSVLLLLMWVSYYSALPLIPLSVAAVAIYTTPIFIALISTRYAGEPLSPLGCGSNRLFGRCPGAASWCRGIFPSRAAACHRCCLLCTGDGGDPAPLSR